jgi:hypothetical protein
MTTPEDIDLFALPEDGRCGRCFFRHGLGEASWLRRRLCLNYVISDSALDRRTLRPFGTAGGVIDRLWQTVYDRFIS